MAVMTPENKFELLKLLLESGAEVRTFYRNMRIVSLEKVDSHVVIRYENGVYDKIHIRDLMRRRFVAVL
jgi:hypothetical protein